jgi:hypothetical protein
MLTMFSPSSRQAAKVGAYGKDPLVVTKMLTETSEHGHVAPFEGELTAISGGIKVKFALLSFTICAPATEKMRTQTAIAARNVFLFTSISFSAYGMPLCLMQDQPLQQKMRPKLAANQKSDCC